MKKILYFKELKKKDHLFFNWLNCNEIDLCASTLLTLIFINLTAKGRAYYLQGTLKTKQEINTLLLKNSFFKYLKANPSFLEEEIKNDKNNIKILPLVAGGKTNLEFSKIDFIAKEIKFDYLFDCCNHVSNFFDSCIKSSNCSLSPNGLNAVNRLVGEVLTNLKEHLRENFSQYFVIGFFKKNNGIGEANLAFINFGDTFYEGLKENSTEDMLENLKEYSKTYIEENSSFDNNFTEEMFWTQLALQVSISRKYIEESSNIRGTGTVSLMDSFFDLKNGSNDNFIPKMTLISGNTKIQFDINDKKYYNEGILIFNKERDILKKQNKNNIRNLKEFFPGTIISLDFTLKNSWIKEGEL